jgi:hypothetical protein
MSLSDNVSPIGDKKPSLPVDILDRVDFAHESLDVEDDSIAEQVKTLFIDDAAGQLVEGILLVAMFDSMTGIAAAIEPGTEGHVRAQVVHEFALALVAPLRPQHGVCLAEPPDCFL